MENIKNCEEGSFCFTTEGKLQHDNDYLNSRVLNLEKFKQMFFEGQHELIEAEAKIVTLEQQLTMIKLKEGVFENNEPIMSDAQSETILAFFKDSFSASSYQDLIMSMFQLVGELSLDVSVQINHHDQVFNYSINDTSEDANIQLLEAHKKDGETVEKENFIVINHNNISMIAKYSSDLNKVEQYKLKEFLKIVALGSNTRIAALSSLGELEELRKNIYKIFRKTNQSFEEVQENIDNQIIKISELFINYEKNIRGAISRIKLSDSHNSLLDIIIKDVRSELNIVLTSTLILDEQFLQTMKKLESSYAKKYSN